MYSTFSLKMTDFTVENIDTPASIDTPNGFEYLDHPADVILHGWGMTFNMALSECIKGLANYMIPVNSVGTSETMKMYIDDIDNDNDAVYLSLDEYLFKFTTELFVAKDVDAFYSEGDHCMNIICYGETFDSNKHRQGTEVKAITYHNLHIYRNIDGMKSHIFVMLDI